MKKISKFLLLALAGISFAFGFASCSSDSDDSNNINDSKVQYNLVHNGKSVIDLDETQFDRVKSVLKEGEDYTVADKTVTLSDSGYYKVEVLK